MANTANENGGGDNTENSERTRKREPKLKQIPPIDLPGGWRLMRKTSNLYRYEKMEYDKIPENGIPPLGWVWDVNRGGQYNIVNKHTVVMFRTHGKIYVDLESGIDPPIEIRKTNFRFDTPQNIALEFMRIHA